MRCQCLVSILLKQYVGKCGEYVVVKVGRSPALCVFLLNLLYEPLPAPNAPPLIRKCNNNCQTCKALITKLYIKSTSKGTHHNLKIKNTINCKTRNVVYIITCTRCQAQYVGMTSQTYTIDLVAICERYPAEDRPTGSKQDCTDTINRSTHPL